MGKKISDQQRIRAIERELGRKFKAFDRQIERMEKNLSCGEEFKKAVTAFEEIRVKLDGLHKELRPLIEEEGKRKAAKLVLNMFEEMGIRVGACGSATRTRCATREVSDGRSGF